MREDWSEKKFIGLKFCYLRTYGGCDHIRKTSSRAVTTYFNRRSKVLVVTYKKKCSQYEKGSKTLTRNTGHGLVSTGNREARPTISGMPQSQWELCGKYYNISTDKGEGSNRDGSICIAHLLWLTSVSCSEDAGASLTCAERPCK